MKRHHIWIMAARPKTLFVALSPIMIAGALALSKGTFHPIIFLCALLAGCLIQVGTNFINDIFDFRKGSDTKMRKGPTRVMAAGLLNTKEMIQGIAVVFALVALFSLYLIAKGGVPIACIAFLSVASAFLYTAGPFSLAYLGIADIFAFLFFGPIPVACIDYLMCGHFNLSSVFLGFSPGFYSAALLCVNNVRDRDEDTISGKKTLPVRFGARLGQQLYFLELILAGVTPLLLAIYNPKWAPIALCSFFAFYAIPFTKELVKGDAINHLFSRTGQLGFKFALALSLCLLLSSLIS